MRDPAGRTLYSRQADLALIPASALKLVTGAVALAQIGGSTRFTTEVRGGPPPRADGTVGDLWLVGGGDPLLSTADFAVDGGYDGQPRLATSMEALADRVVAAGDPHRPGRILGDDSRYDDQRLVPTWLPRYIANFDVGPISALTVNEGFATFPPAPSYALSPAALAADVLAALLRARGVTVGGTGDGRAPAGAAVVASIESPPLTEVVGEILQHSDNMAAEMMVKELGVRFGEPGPPPPAWPSSATTWSSQGLPVEGVATVDGSGLDRSDRVTCELLQQVLATGRRGQRARPGPAGGRPQRHPPPAVRRARRRRARCGPRRARSQGVVALTGWATGAPGRARANGPARCSSPSWPTSCRASRWAPPSRTRW